MPAKTSRSPSTSTPATPPHPFLNLILDGTTMSGPEGPRGPPRAGRQPTAVQCPSRNALEGSTPDQSSVLLGRWLRAARGGCSICSAAGRLPHRATAGLLDHRHLGLDFRRWEPQGRSAPACPVHRQRG